MDKHAAGHPHLHDQLEHAHFNQHDWQGDIKNLLIGSMVLCRHRPEMEDWFAYAYELWLYRSPALSRGDGGSMDGNGYLGVHDEPLTHLNWMLQRLTGYPFFAQRRWFSSFSQYMAYMNAPGNPGVPFCDGGDVSPSVFGLTEMLAHLCPEQPAHLWRLSSVGRRSVEDFSSDLVKGYKTMALLQMWQQTKTPDLQKAVPPRETAAVFLDVGIRGGVPGPLMAPGLLFASSYFSVITPQGGSQNVIFVGAGYLTQRELYRLGLLMTLFFMVIFLTVGTGWIMLVTR